MQTLFRGTGVLKQSYLRPVRSRTNTCSQSSDLAHTEWHVSSHTSDSHRPDCWLTQDPPHPWFWRRMGDHVDPQPESLLLTWDSISLSLSQKGGDGNLKENILSQRAGITYSGLMLGFVFFQLPREGGGFWAGTNRTERRKDLCTVCSSNLQGSWIHNLLNLPPCECDVMFQIFLIPGNHRLKYVHLF